MARWKEGLEKGSKGKVSRMLGVPPTTDGGGEGDADLFPEWDEYLALEKEEGKKGALVDVGVEDGVDGNGDGNDIEEGAEEEEEVESQA